LELAAQRARIEALYASRRRWVRRFKEQLEREQIEYEKKHGESQPWADEVERLAREGKLEEELVLFVRAFPKRGLVSCCVCLAEEGGSESHCGCWTVAKELLGFFVSMTETVGDP
jgi:hypothetical protein